MCEVLQGVRDERQAVAWRRTCQSSRSSRCTAWRWPSRRTRKWCAMALLVVCALSGCGPERVRARIIIAIAGRMQYSHVTELS